MSEQARAYPEDAERTEVLWTLALNEGMADFMWKLIAGQKRHLPYDVPTRAHYADFYQRYIRGRTAEELGTLLITLQDYLDTALDYTDDDYAAADVDIVMAPVVERSEAA